MNTTNTVVLTGTIVTLGRWAQGKGVEMRVVVGAVFLAVILALMAEANDKLAQQFALLILVAAVFVYGVDIVKKAGLTK